MKDVGCEDIHSQLVTCIRPSCMSTFPNLITKSNSMLQTPKPLTSDVELTATFGRMIAYHGSNGARFIQMTKIILAGIEFNDFQAGKFYLVEPRIITKEVKPTVIHVASNGSFSSSSGLFAIFGYPDIYCWKLVNFF